MVAANSEAQPVSWLNSWQARHRLTLAGFFMCMLLYSHRFNLSIGIVAMVDDGNLEAKTTSDRHHGEMCPALRTLISKENTSVSLEKSQNDGGTHFTTFPWSESDQGLILGSFFWGYVLSQFPGGMLAQKYGSKWIISLGVLWSGIFSMTIPHAALLGGKYLLIFVRILQGIAQGMVIPAVHVLLARWTPTHERAHLSAICFAGLPFGTAFTMIVSGHLITTFGWPSVFYMPGILTIFWFLIWTRYVYSSPQQHPSISKSELNYLEESLGSDSPEEDVGFWDVPWKEIFCSVPFWAIFVSQFCNAWGHNMLKAEGPKYLHSALHFDIHQNSYLSATPYICQWLFCLAVGRASDYMIKTKRLSVLRARKLCNTIGQWGTAASFAGIVLSGCNRNTAVIFFIFSGLLNGAMLCGTIINPIDIAPNYVGPIEGFINSAANIAGFGAPYVAGLILDHEPSIVGWRYVFFIPVIANLIGNTAFLMGASVKKQPWNEISKKALDNKI